ncbi:MAG: polysialyltransferase family glycosyltransferase [Planctomycetota bacterium]
MCVSVGAWQLVTLAAGLRAADAADGAGDTHDVLLLDLHGLEASVAASFRALASGLWDWDRVVELEAGSLPRTRGASGRAMVEQGRALVAGLGLDQADELWICGLFEVSQRVLIEAFPGAGVTLYEDGLHSYVPGRRSGGLLKRVMLGTVGEWTSAGRVKRASIAAGTVARLKRAVWLLDDQLPVPPALARIQRLPVSAEVLRGVLEQAVGVAEASGWAGVGEGVSDGPERLVVLGQCYAQASQMSREAEAELYHGVVGDVLAMGYDVLWKEHPRLADGFGPGLREAFGDRVVLGGLPGWLPIEAVAARLNVAGCVSATSTSLFYLKKLGMDRVYTFADRLPGSLHRSYGVMQRMVTDRLEALPSRTGGGGGVEGVVS